ncbi:hypothetical protein VFPPC_01178 [Pochonia chlamydosporia 170]|uniref:Uncharacterized protein n=1 Tax=Pochonia chlamydosporia 170 TaxID=1380566 RepID=A0A179G7J6_METCM|nr:hypothetical protein VFPPC_01178 [Pochonia chlamydosporia 170]OAQ73480.1 hypothetical protein VFPPC_01178 [Pochonia chlamydosporia 170]
MEKLQLQVRTTEGEPTIKSRNRVLFHLKHPKKGEMCMFPYQAESQSRQTLGNMGIERSDAVFKTGRRFRFVPAKWGADRRLRKEGKQVLFEAAENTGHRRNGVVWEWRNGDGELVARELFRDGELSLGVTAAMTARERDALVAAWYLRIWWIRGEETYERPKFRDESGVALQEWTAC